MGGLQVCAGSHRSGVDQVRPALGAGSVEVTDLQPEDWRYNPVGQGDLILFHSMIVHQGVCLVAVIVCGCRWIRVTRACTNPSRKRH